MFAYCTLTLEIQKPLWVPNQNRIKAHFHSYRTAVTESPPNNIINGEICCCEQWCVIANQGKMSAQSRVIDCEGFPQLDNNESSAEEVLVVLISWQNKRINRGFHPLHTKSLFRLLYSQRWRGCVVFPSQLQLLPHTCDCMTCIMPLILSPERH